MKINRKKLELAMARSCMDSSDLSIVSGLPSATVKNAITGKGIRPSTMGKIAKALNVDPSELIEQED